MYIFKIYRSLIIKCMWRHNRWNDPTLKRTYVTSYDETYSARFHFEVEALRIQVPDEGVPFPDFFLLLQ